MKHHPHRPVTIGIRDLGHDLDSAPARNAPYGRPVGQLRIPREWVRTELLLLFAVARRRQRDRSSSASPERCHQPRQRHRNQTGRDRGAEARGRAGTAEHRVAVIELPEYNDARHQSRDQPAEIDRQRAPAGRGREIMTARHTISVVNTAAAGAWPRPSTSSPRRSASSPTRWRLCTTRGCWSSWPASGGDAGGSRRSRGDARRAGGARRARRRVPLPPAHGP